MLSRTFLVKKLFSLPQMYLEYSRYIIFTMKTCYLSFAVWHYNEETLLQAVHAVMLFNKVKEKHHANVGNPTALTSIKERNFVHAFAEFGSPLTIISVRMPYKNYMNIKGIQSPIFKENIPGKI